MTGLTTWWAKDAAWHRRERQVELGEEFGAAGPHVLDVLCSWAQEQRGMEGFVRGGWRALAREAFVTVGNAESIITRAAELGAVDELLIDQDGRHFTCRISGWTKDQERGRTAWRVARHRERAAEKRPPAPQAPSVTDRDAPSPTVTGNGPKREVTRTPQPDHRYKGEEERAHARPDEDPVHPRLSEVLQVLRQADGLLVEDGPVLTAITSHPDADPVKAAGQVVAWATAGTNRYTHAGPAMFAAFRVIEQAAARAAGIRDATEKHESARLAARVPGGPRRPQASRPRLLADLGDELIAEALNQTKSPEES